MASTDRGLASGFLGFVAIIVVLALLYTLFDPAVSAVTTTSTSATSNSQAQSVIDQRAAIWENILFYGIFLAAIFVLARGVLESRRPG